MAYKLQQIARESGFLENQLNSQKALEYVEKILQIEQIFGSDLQHHFELVQQLTLLLRAMTKNGVCSVLQQTIAA
jgi:mannitol-1-phosphate/altronate dehydrogenase